MTKNNDDLILELTKEIEKREKEIQKTQNFTPITNCSVKLFNETYNLHVLGVIELYVLKGVLSGIDKEVRDTLKINGFSVSEYLDDIQKIIRRKETNELTNELQHKKNRLKELLSVEAKKREELADIQKSLGL